MGLFAFFSKGGSSDGLKSESKYKQAQEDETSLGNILLEMELVTEQDLEEAIKIQRSQLMLGGILVRMGVITAAQLEEALLVQRVRRNRARSRDVIAANSIKQKKLVEEVKQGFVDLNQKMAVGKE